MSLTRSSCCHHLCFSDAAMCPWCGQAFESGALERVAIAGEKAFKRNAYAIFQWVSGIVGGAALFSTSKLKTKWHYFVVPRANGEGKNSESKK